MRKPQHQVDAILLVLIVVLCFTRSAQAYIDPGTGSFILQVVIGGALGCLVALKVFWRQVCDFVKRIFSRKPSD